MNFLYVWTVVLISNKVCLLSRMASMEHSEASYHFQDPIKPKFSSQKLLVTCEWITNMPSRPRSLNEGSKKTALVGLEEYDSLLEYLLRKCWVWSKTAELWGQKYLGIPKTIWWCREYVLWNTLYLSYTTFRHWYFLSKYILVICYTCAGHTKSIKIHSR